MEAFNNFHSQEMFEKSFNATYIALIPKKTGAKELRDFRPISLIGSFYKLLSKVLTERLKRVVGKLVDAQQMAFIKGRQIMDAVLIANEAVDSRIKQKKPGILCKLDIEKAYDHVNWRFLLKMLEQRGFGQKWVNWMKFCISTVRFSILINGSPEGFFPAYRGLRQGDPLSPFLFIIAMEGLNNMIKAAKVNLWVKGFEVDRNGSNSLEITHLQYADDTLVFCDAEEEQLRFLRIILVLFEGISGLHINWRKSHIYPINEVYNMEQLTFVLGGEVGSLPTTYLGMPLGARSKSKEIWNSVIEKCEKKMSRWKAQYLSMGGRLVLINSVLDSLPTYMMSLFPIPARVIQRLDKIRRSFLWQGNKEKKVFHLVKWKSLTVAKRQGGLGIRNLKNQSKALKMKWLWRYSQESQNLWSKVIKAKYGEENNWVSKKVSTSYGVGVWKSIWALWPTMKNHTFIRVNNGRKTSFWNDNWLGHRCLKELYPDMFGLAQNQQKTVAEMWTSQG